MSYPEFGSGPYDSPPACQHEYQRYSDGVFCRKCYRPHVAANRTDERIRALEERVAQLEARS